MLSSWFFSSLPCWRNARGRTKRLAAPATENAGARACQLQHDWVSLETQRPARMVVFPATSANARHLDFIKSRCRGDLNIRRRIRSTAIRILIRQCPIADSHATPLFARISSLYKVSTSSRHYQAKGSLRDPSIVLSWAVAGSVAENGGPAALAPDPWPACRPAIDAAGFLTYFPIEGSGRDARRRAKENDG